MTLQIFIAHALSLLVLVTGLGVATLADTVESSGSESPEQILKDFLRAMYSRDAGAAYGLLASTDRQVKSLDDYAGEIAAFEGRALVLSRTLAEGIEFSNMRADVVGSRATIVFDAALPNANDPVVDKIVRGFSRSRLTRLSPEQMRSLEQALRTKVRSNQLPVLRSSGEAWHLVRENGAWRVFQNWAEAVEVTFSAFTVPELGWEFTPVRDRVMAKHGETVQMAYRAKNTGSVTTTGKARHIIGPGKDSEHLEIVSCFCFLEQTLDPGEQVELPLVFRVNYEAPEDAKTFTVLYEFYPLRAFPGEKAAEAPVSGDRG